MLSAVCLQLFFPPAAHMAYVIMRRYYCDAPLLFDTGWRGFSFPPNSFSRRASHVRVKFLSIYVYMLAINVKKPELYKSCYPIVCI
jgi:hypothetical protein